MTAGCPGDALAGLAGLAALAGASAPAAMVAALPASAARSLIGRIVTLPDGLIGRQHRMRPASPQRHIMREHADMALNRR
ncbi:MAG TPA: hypothetical protein VFI65_08220 [Streptosporangiaceae bacterium]|nr:hypothetical protein [Streptosporangiaceae bacterium]